MPATTAKVTDPATSSGAHSIPSVISTATKKAVQRVSGTAAPTRRASARRANRRSPSRPARTAGAASSTRSNPSSPVVANATAENSNVHVPNGSVHRRDRNSTGESSSALVTRIEPTPATSVSSRTSPPPSA
ncbi:MAG: hypothetical protein ACRDJP_11295, partial [Actinomycetota bacterium]